jgi:ABC-2 type transport system ATP-binding protein
MLQVDNLIKAFPNTLAVNKLSFHLKRGEICGFVGPNGAGKTTTMRMIATLEEPTAGEISLDGVSIFEDPYQVRRMIGFMPDHYGTYHGMTVRDYLEFYARAYEIDGSLRKNRIGDILEFTGLEQIEGKMVESLSKGMRQRLNLGRALVNDPKIMIMDEPAAGLDPRARIELRYLIKNLAERDKTVFVSSHILTELSEMCDRMLVIDKGSMITFGTLEDIQRGLQNALRIQVRLTHEDQKAGLERFLLERPGISDVVVEEGTTISFTLGEEMDKVPPLMKEILNAGFLVIEFKPCALTMEEAFIQITEGLF